MCVIIEEIVKMRSARFKQKHCHLAHVEIYEMLGFVSDIRSEVSAHNAVPCGIVLFIELLLDIGGYIFLDVEFLKGNISAINRILLHFFVHVRMLDHCFSFGCRHIKFQIQQMKLLSSSFIYALIIRQVIFLSYLDRQIGLMSRFRGSPSRSPFRSPPRLYQVERDAIIQDQIRLKSALRAESDFRRVSDELALLQVKVRHTNDLEDKVENLLRQNNQLARDNDELARELSEKRYELERLRISASEHHERESIRNGQLYEANKSLELEIELMKKERVQGNRIYEANIIKLERLLDEKVIELDSMTLKSSDLAKQLELTVIKFEEERNRLKNIMTRTEHELERQLEYTKQRTTTEKFSEIDTLKRNFGAQIALLEDEISKLKLLNQVKSEQFEGQLAENKGLRKRHDEQVRMLGAENDDLRARMLKLEEINRSEVENIQVKYSDYHTQGTTNLKEQHNREIKLLLDEVDKLKWLVGQKNNEIQNLVQDKRDLRRALDEKQLQLGSEIESLKNQKYAQSEKYAEESHNQMARVNELIDKSLRDSESYHERVKQFKNKISKLQAEINDKQNILQNQRGKYQGKIKELNRVISENNFSLQKLKRDLSDSEDLRAKAESQYKDYQTKTQKQLQDLHKKLNQTEVKLEELTDKHARHAEDNKGNEDLLRIQIDSLRQTIAVLEQKLSTEQSSHAKEMNEFSANLNEKLKKLQAAQKKAIEDLEKGFKQQLQALNLRLEKTLRDKDSAENELKRYIAMYGDLQKYFKNPHDGALFEEKSKDSIYKVLEKVSKSSIHIF